MFLKTSIAATLLTACTIGCNRSQPTRPATPSLAAPQVAEERFQPETRSEEPQGASAEPSGSAETPPALASGRTSFDDGAPEESLDAEIARLIEGLDSAEIDLDRPFEGTARLCELGEPAVSALIEAARNGSWKRRCGAMLVLGRLESDAKVQALPAILANIDFQHDDDVAAQTVRVAAVRSLGSLGLRDPAIERGLLELIIRETDQEVVHATLGALGKLGVSPDADPEPLIGALQSEHEGVRREAAWLLGELAPQETALDDVVMALVATLSDDDEDVREAAYGSLGQLGKGRPHVTLALIPLLESDDVNLRYRAAFTLSLIGRDAHAASPTLLHLINHEQDEATRTEAINALREIDPKAATGLSTPPDDA